MTQKQFIEYVAKYVSKYAPQFNIKVYSPIIAQFCLESGYGTSNKVKVVLPNGITEWRHNYVGLKWRNNRCKVSNDYFEEITSEQSVNGVYTRITSKFFRFKSLEDCVIGYFQFTNISNYSNLKNVTDPKTYLKNIKEDKYATSIDYVEKCMRVINEHNLTKYDPYNANKSKGESNMSIKIAIDAGHGSTTSGKRTPDGYREHWINVKCAHYCMVALKRCGFDVVKIGWNDTNATDDADVSLTKRQSQIKTAKCNSSVSFHANAHGNGEEYTSAKGVETLIHSKSYYVKDSKRLATKVQARLLEGTQQTNRGVKTQSLAMCNCLACGTNASILVEIGFMTNKVEADLMKTDSFCKEQAEEVAHGICDYYGVEYKKISSDSSKVTTNVSSTQYNVRITIPNLNIRKTPSAKDSSNKTGSCTGKGTFTIVDTATGPVNSSGKIGTWGLLKSYQKNRNGWICLDIDGVDKV